VDSDPAEHRCRHAGRHGPSHLRQRLAGPGFHRQVLPGHGCRHDAEAVRRPENFKDYILGKYDNTPKTPEWAAAICGVSAADIRKLAEMYATTKPAALKASWAPGRASYGEQYNRMAAALQAMTGNIGILGGSAEGRQGLAPRGGSLPLRRVRQRLVGLDQVRPLGALRAELPQRQARGSRAVAARRTGRQDSQHQGHLLARLGLVQPADQHQQGNRRHQEAGTGRLHGFDHHAIGPVGRCAVPDRHPLRAA
jgi:anaerobic selenocysteine-containing dehydrogenase